MARFHFNSRNALAGRRTAPAVSRRTLEALHLEEATADDEPLGPGWFDSSWDLVRGLEVREAAPSDTPLNDWLSWCLRAAAEDSAAAQRDEQPGARLVPAPAHGALGDAEQLGDLGLAVAAEVAHLDEFSQFGIDGLELV
jgi:hypothetical protein